MTETTAGRRVTRADIAREVGVSRATVGFVLNATPGQTISEGTQQRVLAAAERMGYRPHLAAQALASGRNHIVLLVLPDWPLEYSMRRHIDEASAALDEAGYSLVTTTPHANGKARPLWETLQPDVVMGMTPFSDEQFQQISASGVTAVIPHPDSRAQAPEFSFNFNHGPRLQVEHLLAQGRRLAYAASTDPRLTELVSSRHALASSTAVAAGQARLDSVGIDADNALASVEAWHRAGITGIVAYNDDIAALVVGSAIRLGLSIPDQLAVVGHDDAPIASVFVPAITTVHVDDEGLGRYFAHLALSAAHGEAAPSWDATPQVSLRIRETS